MPKKEVSKATNRAKSVGAVAGGRRYVPTEKEKYMSAQQLKYFRQLLEEMRRNIFNNAENMIGTMQDQVNSIPDETDRANKESEFTVELRERERELRLLHKIDAAQQRVENKNFGYCKECGEEIGIKRLLARPVATLCFECKCLQEQFEKSGGTSPLIVSG